MKIQIGDKIKLYYKINNIKIEDYATITYIDNNNIYTCGHCFPKNAYTHYGNLIYSSGFDEPSEGKEIAIINIKNSMKHMFKNIKIDNNFIYSHNVPTVLINCKNKYKGQIIYQVSEKLELGWNKLQNGYKINHTITKLNEPYYLVKINDKLDKNGEYIHGLSGSPWIVYQNGITLVGGHIGRTDGKDIYNNDIMISYVKPLKINSI